MINTVLSDDVAGNHKNKAQSCQVQCLVFPSLVFPNYATSVTTQHVSVLHVMIMSNLWMWTRLEAS